ncbi:MAG: pilus assembly protein TadG-related protein [Actinomycetota bacterium]
MSRLRDVRQRCQEDRGYAVVLTALCLVPLMGFAGFAVDIGAWYSHASKAQRAADAAALAGVVWQPDFPSAEAAARAEAARNGFVHGVDDVQVIVRNVRSTELEVEIVDGDVETYFGGLFLDDVSIARQAVAEYASPVPMGSPTNYIGAGSQSFGGVGASNAWAGMMGHCSPSSWGDLLSLRTRDWRNNSDCGSVASPYHDPGGYRWIVDVPAGSGTVDVNIWDIGYCTSRAGSPLNTRDRGNSPIVFTLYDKDNTPLTHADNVNPGNILAQHVGAPGEGCNTWSGPALHGLQITGGEGQYVITTAIVDSDGTQSFSKAADARAQNYFSFHVVNAANPTGCTAVTSATCPGIFADEWMPVRADATLSPANFYLAEIEPAYAGQTMRISMWDLGEGMKSVEILDPAGNALDFTWEVTYAIGTSGASGTATNTNPFAQNYPSQCRTGGVCGTCDLSQFCLFVTDSVFNGDLVEIDLEIPVDYSTYSNNWYQVRYTLVPGFTTPDWTTWGVQVLGDPVRLLE